MTQFDKKQFTCYGGYLYYHGDYEGCPVYDETAHPTRVGTRKPLFIARFKYNTGPFTKAKVQSRIINRFTVEQYAAESENKAPLEILREDDPIWYEKTLTVWKIKMLKNASR